jgi:signal transduction histidine kinase
MAKAPARSLADTSLLLDVLRCLPAGLIVVDAEGTIVYCNPMADSIRHVGERLGGPVAGCHPSRSLPALEELLQRFRHTPPDRQHPLVVERGGKWEVCYQRVTGEDGSFRGIVWLAHDISRQKLLQQQLLHHERMAGLGNMAARLAHDIRNPLNVVAGAVHNLKPHVREPVAQEMVGLIEEQLARLQRLVAQLREATRPLKPRFGQVEVGSWLESFFRQKPPELQKRVRWQDLTENLVIPADVDLLSRFLDNALDNALRVAPRVEVRAEVETKAEGEWLALQVRDFGPGFSPEVLQQLFQPFVTTRPEGLGLGLVIMREICLLHGGDVEVKNHPEGGAVVVGRFLTR